MFTKSISSSAVIPNGFFLVAAFPILFASHYFGVNASPQYFTKRIDFENALTTYYAVPYEMESFEDDSVQGSFFVGSQKDFGDFWVKETGQASKNLKWTEHQQYVTDGSRAVMFLGQADSIGEMEFHEDIYAFGVDISMQGEDLTTVQIALDGVVADSIDLVKINSVPEKKFWGVIETETPFSTITFDASLSPNLGWGQVTYAKYKPTRPPSASPTSAPTATSVCSYVGAGFCLDANDYYYDYCEKEFMTLEDCAVETEAIVGTSRGFEFGGTHCNIMLEAGVGASGCPDGFEFRDEFSYPPKGVAPGSGVVTSVFPDDNVRGSWVCYSCEVV